MLIDEWMADLAAGRDYVSQWEDEYGPIRAGAEDRDDYVDEAGADHELDALDEEGLEL